MDMNNLLAFIEVAEEKSFSRSAEKLKLTQPAVSKRIAALETELSSRLFDRVGRTVNLTEAGRVLLPSALKINSEVSRIESELCNLGKEVKGKLSIGASEHIGADRLAPLLKIFHAKYPEVHIDLHFSNSSQILDDINNGLTDMGICADCDDVRNDRAHSRLLAMEIWKDQLSLVTETHHPLTRRESITVAMLSEFPAILPEEKSKIRKTVNRIMNNHEVEVNVSLEASDFPTMKSMASIGLGWALLPKSEVDESLAVINVDDLKLSHSVALVRNPDRTMSRASQAFVDTLPSMLM